MERKQLWAKVGVFLLVLGNMGAYYAFWPTNSGANNDQPDRPAESKKEPSPASVQPTFRLPEVKDAPKPPAPADVKPAQDAPAPLALPGLPELPMQAAPQNKPETPKVAPQGLPPMVDQPKPAAPPASPLDQLDKQTVDLLNQIKAQGQPPVAAPVTSIPGIGSPPAPQPTQGLPPIEIPPLQPKPASPPPAPAVQPGPAAQPMPMDVAPAALQKIENSPWMLQMEIVSGQTLLIAKLHKQVEFKILCDRVEMKAPDGAVQAVGKVSVTGSGLKGTCERLTLPLAEDRLLFEGKAEVSIEDRAAPSPAQRWEMRGERLNVRLAQLPALQGSPPPARLAPASLLEPALQK